MTDKAPTTLEFALLGLVTIEPRAGYDLLTVFKSTAMGNYSSSPGAIYPALARLEKRGLVEGSVDGAQALRPRKVFRPTAAGEETLRQWLRSGITRDDVRRRLDELLLRFAFHSLLEAGASRDFLNSLARQVEEYVVELQAQRKLFPGGGPPQGKMAFEFGLEQYRACARWARRMIPHFEE